MNQTIASSIRSIPGHPKPGIIFRDITTLLENPKAFRMTIDQFVQRYIDQDITAVAGIESRGFVFGSVLAYELSVPFLSIRKAGKLPAETISESYQLEYGEDVMEIHKDCVKTGDRVLIIDDLIATGGTVSAAIKLVRQLGGVVVESCFVIDLPDLGGSKKVQEEMDCPCYSICEFEGD
jgi:adenine phosphoribosyltransferase